MTALYYLKRSENSFDFQAIKRTQNTVLQMFKNYTILICGRPVFGAERYRFSIATFDQPNNQPFQAL